MCLGIPMQVVESRDGIAVCEGMGERREINMQLVGEQRPGTWVLTFLDAAREVLTEADAHRISDAVMAVNLVMQGHTDVDHLFADLVDRDPPRPASLPPDKG